MIYSSKTIPIKEYKYIKYIENSIKYFCRIYNFKDYKTLYKQKFYENDLGFYLFLIYFMEHLSLLDFIKIQNIYFNIKYAEY